MIGAKCQAESTEMGRPLRFETVAEPMRAGPDDSEHDVPPGAVPLCAKHRIERPVHPDDVNVTHLAGT
ncbi:hypothetical protein [Streptomyces sp. NPDC059092]|uniref:hypothetical protein n=1 Tax=Streptomyces sp. NPDC059092 TaxID=3346725 RepID=UPI0036C0ECE5